MTKAITQFKTPDEFKVVLYGQYQKQIQNFFGDEKRALEFLSNVVVSVQRVPELLECTPETLVNSFMQVAQLKFMPSDVSGEAYVLPYRNNKLGVREAQFQLGYQGLVTLFYRAGVTGLGAEIVRENDEYTYTDGEFTLTIDPTKSEVERGKPIGAYVFAYYNGAKMSKFMNGKDIEAHGKKYSKSYNSKYSPWKTAPDWMWKKTVLKQMAKLMPKNSTINEAIAADNKDSNIQRIDNNKLNADTLLAGAPTMGSLNAANNDKKENKDVQIPDQDNPFADSGKGAETDKA